MTSLADDTRWMDATAQADLVRSGQVSPGELAEAAIERIERINPALNAVVIEWFDDARADLAARVPSGPFAGVPFLLKDLYAEMSSKPITNGNRALRDSGYRSAADTTLVARYRAAGLSILGRTNSPEWGSVPTTEPEHFGPTRNPWDLARSPGGSSGGAAAAVAAGLVPFAHASDGGGSIRIPAAACGLVGLKPSQGRITLGPTRSESGLSVEHCVSRTVRDTAALLDATKGPGVGDAVIAPVTPLPYADEVGRDAGRLRIGVLDHNPRGGPVDPECAAGALAAGRLLESLGHSVEAAWPAVLGDNELGARFSAMWTTMMAMAARTLETQIGREVTEADVEAMNWVQVQIARSHSAADYAAAVAAIAGFRRAMQAWWAPVADGGEGFDLLVTPTLAHRPPTIGTIVNDPSQPYSPLLKSGVFVPFTPPFNTSGQPAISLPLYWADDGFPVGVQLVAAYGREDVLFRIAAQLEQAAPWAHRTPNL